MAIYKIKCCNKLSHQFIYDANERETVTIYKMAPPAEENIVCYCTKCNTPNMITIDPRDKSSDVKEIDGRPVTGNALEIIKQGQELVKQSPDVLDGAAKSMITLDTSLITVYTAALAFLKIPDKLATVPYGIGWILMAIPIICWLASIERNASVYNPKGTEIDPDSPKSIVSALKAICERKYKKLTDGKYWFVAALAIAVTIILLGSSYQVQPASVQFVVSDSHAAQFKNLSISVDSNTMRTSQVTLLQETDKTYKVQLPGSNQVIVFNKDMVTGLVYV